MSIHFHHFPLNYNTSSFMHIPFRFQPNISPTQLDKHKKRWIPHCCHTRTNNRKFCCCHTRTSGKKKICCCHTRTSSKKKNLAAATQEPAARKESLLLPHKNQQWEEINQLLEGCSFQLWHFFACGNYKSSMVANWGNDAWGHALHSV